MIFAALNWIRSTLCNNAGEQVPQTSMPYVALVVQELRPEKRGFALPSPQKRSDNGF